MVQRVLKPTDDKETGQMGWTEEATVVGLLRVVVGRRVKGDQQKWVGGGSISC